MITSATTPAQQAEFARRIAGKPYFAAVMGTALTLFGQKPGSGWSFYLLPGGALALRGGTATLCGALPDADTAEELQSFLQFVCTDRVLTEQPLRSATDAVAAAQGQGAAAAARAARAARRPDADRTTRYAAGQPVGVCGQSAGRRLLLGSLHSHGARHRLLPRPAAGWHTRLHGRLLQPKQDRKLYVGGRHGARLAGQGAGRLADRAYGE